MSLVQIIVDIIVVNTIIIWTNPYAQNANGASTLTKWENAQNFNVLLASIMIMNLSLVNFVNLHVKNVIIHSPATFAKMALFIIMIFVKPNVIN